jgi:hypothetical protein
MLCLGVMQPAHLRSQVILIKKQDGSWWFCVDYHALNAKTVKDKFLIPVVEELLDELCDTTFFIKLDLRSCYHQVLMDPDDIAKMAFHTHRGYLSSWLCHSVSPMPRLLSKP